MSRLASRLRQRELEATHLRRVAEAVQAGEEAEAVVANPQALAGDERRVRGLPAIGRNVSGAVPGTDPVRALVAKERWQRS